MKTQLLVLALAGALLPAFAGEDTVTISKSRLEALEKKEAELEKLKAAQGPQPAPVTQPAPATPAVTASQPASSTPGQKTIVIPPPPQPKPVTLEYPSVETMSALRPGDSVNAGMLAAQFKMEPAGAAKRYAGRRFIVTGTIARFERPLLFRNYKVVLQTPGVEFPVTFDFYPEKFKAVFTTDNGKTLVGTLQNEARVTLARVGQPVAIEGECRGASGNTVRFVSSRFTEAGKGS